MTLWKVTACLFATTLLVACSNGPSDKELLDSSKDYLDKGKPRAAAIQLKSVLQQNPNNLEARWLLGKTHLEIGSPADAEKELKRAQELGMANEALLPLLARALASQGKLKDLLAIQINGLSTGAQTQILASQASALIAQNELDQAEDRISHALSLQPNSVAALTEQARLLTMKGELALARSQMEKLLEQHDTYAPAWSLLGDIHRLDQQPEKAEDAFNKAINYRFNNFSDRLKRTLVRIELKNYEGAQADIDLLNKRLPNYFEVHYAQGLVHFYQQHYPQAQSSFEAALKGNDNFQQAQFYLGATYAQLGMQEQAEQLISRFFAANPRNIAGRKVLAQIRLKAGDLAEVEQLLLPVIRANESDAESLKILALTFMQQGRSDEGVKLFSKIVLLQPKSAIAHLDLASALLVSGNEDEGLKHLETAKTLDPKTQQSADEILTRYYLTRKEFDKALATAEIYRQRQPKLVGPYNLLGLIHVAKQEAMAANAAFNKAREIAPGDITANHTLATLAIQDKDFAAARQRYEEVLAYHADHLDTLMKLALLDEQEDLEKEMVKHLQQAVKSHPDAVEPRVSLARHYLAKNKPEQVTVALGDLQQTQFTNPLVLNVLGLSQLAQHAAADAKVTLKKLVELQPNSAQAHYLLALAYAQHGDATALQTELEKTILLESSHTLARLALARLSLRQQNIESAKQQLTALKANAPDNPDVISLEAKVAQASGKQKEALDLYSELFENVSSTTTMLALAQQKWAMGDKEGTRTLLAQWIEMHPKEISARLRLAQVLGDMGHTTDAIKQYEMILAQSKNNLTALNNLTWQLYDSAPSQALKYAEKANSLAPNSAEISDTLAIALMKNGEIERALRVNERIVNKFTENPTFLYHRAMILEAAGRISEATSVLTSLLNSTQSFPEHQEAKQMLTRLKK